MLIIDHLRKGVGADSDAVVDLLGSTAKAALCDAVMGLYRERGKAQARLLVTGRDIEERSLALTMDWQTGLWRCEGRADAFELMGRQAEIVEVIREMGSAGIVEIAKAVDLNKGTAYRVCSELLERGAIVKGRFDNGVVRYSLSNEVEEDDEEDIEMP
ncbi:MAG: helix-turn-helix domain-containing protein [Deltaproteobacteria bacterium]|nr:helix-turn-helix domain-containing protein [Candidatus Zymogenaceae bacterium]